LLKLIFPISGLWIWLADHKAKNNRNLSLGYCLLFSIISIVCLTGERTATALALLILILSLLAIGINNRSLRIYMIMAIGVVIIAFTAIIYNSSSIQIRAMRFINDVSNFEASLYGQLFKASILTWQEHIFTGVGLQQFRHACPAFEAQGLVTYCDLHSHNIYLEILSETGLIGFGLFAAFVTLCLYKAIVAILRNRGNLSIFIINIFALAGLCTIFFPLSVTMSFITNWSGTLNWLGISLCISLLKLR
jgi:O-antigen ligase